MKASVLRTKIKEKQLLFYAEVIIYQKNNLVDKCMLPKNKTFSWIKIGLKKRR
jgi:alanine racemase